MTNLPLLIFEGPILNCYEKQKISNDLLKIHKEKEIDQYSFVVPFENIFFDKLFSEIENICVILFKENAKLMSHNKRMCCYCSNSIDFATKWHNHPDSSCSFIYYLNVPDSEGGEILFEHENNIFSFKPTSGIIICFPSYVKHVPRPSNSIDYRIALNINVG
jgi:hypothetical protein